MRFKEKPALKIDKPTLKECCLLPLKLLLLSQDLLFG